MKALFVHDFRATKYNDVYYSTNLSYDIWKERYLIHADEIKVCCRVINTENNPQDKLSVSSGKGVTFVDEIGNYVGPEIIFSKRIQSILKKNILESDFVIVRVGSFLGELATNICRDINKPFLTEVVSCSWDAFWNHGVSGKILAPYAYLSEKKVVKNSSDVIYVTNKFLQKRYPTRGKCTNCSNVQLELVDNQILEYRLKRLDNLNRKKIIGTIGALNVRYKGQQYVIKALARLKRKGINDFEYQLVGGGDDSYLRKLIERYKLDDCVKIVGRMRHEEINEWLDTIDIYIQPSRQEGLPRSLIEAMSRGVFCLGANTAGIPELIDSNRVFQNSRLTYKYIADMLISTDGKIMKADAVRNYNEAKKYTKNIIEQRRCLFFKEFIRTEVATKGAKELL